ncbi:protein E28 [Elephant endotheliotropic herpesvirus 3B]|nr:protein E28 [Elephant endotheliotropic herpesvirus 3B]
MGIAGVTDSLTSAASAAAFVFYVALFIYLLTSPSNRSLKYILCSQLTTIGLILMLRFVTWTPGTAYVCRDYGYRLNVLDLLTTLYMGNGVVCLAIHLYSLYQFFYHGMFDLWTSTMLLIYHTSMVQTYYIAQSTDVLSCNGSVDLMILVKNGVYLFFVSYVVHELVLTDHANIHERCTGWTTGAFLASIMLSTLSVLLSDRHAFPGGGYQVLRDLSGRFFILGSQWALTSFSGVAHTRDLSQFFTDPD